MAKTDIIIIQILFRNCPVLACGMHEDGTAVYTHLIDVIIRIHVVQYDGRVVPAHFSKKILNKNTSS